jgi:hypothetical protein
MKFQQYIKIKKGEGIVSHSRNTRRKAIQNYLERKKLGVNYIVVNGEKCVYQKINNEWKLKIFEG